MEFLELVKTRRSVRKFSEKPVEKEKLLKILQMVKTAPSAGNVQAYKITIVRDQESKEKLVKACLDQTFIAEATFVLVFSALQDESAQKYGDRGREVYSFQDATIAAAYSQLAATDLGLATVWIGAFDPLEISRLINAGAYEVPTAIIPVGYAGEEPDETPRKTFDKLLREI